MITTVPTKTITKVLDEGAENLSINCFASMNDDGTTFPEIYDSEVLGEDLSINDVHGLEGELLITSENTDAANIEEGDLILTTKEDDAERYSVNDNGDLIYEEQ